MNNICHSIVDESERDQTESVDPSLADEQLQFFNKKGYLLLKQLIPREICLEVGKLMESLLRGEKQAPFFSQDQKNKNQIFQAHLHDPFLMNLISYPPIPQVLQQLLGAPPLLCQSMFFFHAPPKGSPHQDEFFMAPDPLPLIATWTALQDITPEDGALNVIPGSQRGSTFLAKHVKGKWWEDPVVFQNYYARVEEITDRSQRVTTPMRAGDVLFFHGRTIHWGNESFPPDRKRHSYACHFMRSDATLDQSNNSVFLEPVPLTGPVPR